MQPVIFETSRGNVTVREGIFSDASQFRELRLDALQNSPIAFSADLQLNLNHPISFWEDRLNFNEHSMIFFAEHGNNLIGMTGISQREPPKTKHGADIFSVYTRPEWRGLHIAEMLIKACVHWAQARNVNILRLGVTATNSSAVRLYERCGFKIYGTEPRDIFYEGTYYDLHLMYKEIA
jgi:RimJ/RimL family protein N-acetyltransferase